MRQDVKNQLADKVHQYIQQHRLIKPSDRVLVAFSGGPDSTALLHVLHVLIPDLGFNLEALHINHGTRGSEALRDETFCRDTAVRLGLPFHRADFGSATPPANNREEWMREQRYVIFSEYLEKKCDKLALGHHRDDQAETFLLRLFRGAGLAGLSCMRPSTANGVIRPFLATGREEILEFLHSNNIPFREDRTNRDMRFLRNRIRHKIIPRLQEEIHPSVSNVLARTADVLQLDYDALNEIVRKTLNEFVLQESGCLTFTMANFLHSPETLQPAMVREIIHRAKGNLRRLNTGHFRQVLDFIRHEAGEKRLILPGPVTLVSSCGMVLIYSDPPRDTRFEYHLEVPGSVFIPETGETYHAAVATGQEVEDGAVSFPVTDRFLWVRNFRPGDRVQTKAGRKKVKKLFGEKKIPTFQRRFLSILTDSNHQIIWIPKINYKMWYNMSGTDGIVIKIKREKHE